MAYDKVVDSASLDSKLTQVADAIRTKGNTSADLQFPSGFISAIQAIQTGTELQIIVTVKSGATVTATKGSKVVSGASVNGTCTLTVPEAGTWSVKATLGGQTSDTKSVIFTDRYTTSLTFFSATITVTVESGASVALKKNGTTLQTKTSTGTVVFTVTETGAYTVDATKNGQTVSGSVSVVSSTTSYALTLSFVSAVLNDNDWAKIREVSDKGDGANYWSIGDCKEVTLNGTVGQLSLSNYTTYAFIIGFNHNAELEGQNRIHFQLGKTALSGGTDVALCDGYYGSNNSINGFEMNHNNESWGGWKSSHMRTEICGTSLTSYSGTILAVIPAALRAAIKPVTKYTNNSGNNSSASAVTATTDYFFPLSEYEVLGTSTNSNGYERDKQVQYSYYSAGNSKIKYNHGAISTAIFYWTRSPSVNAEACFMVVMSNGASLNYKADISSGFAPGFCV